MPSTNEPETGFAEYITYLNVKPANSISILSMMQGINGDRDMAQCVSNLWDRG